jgi:lipopolysaccharide transport system permease protein
VPYPVFAYLGILPWGLFSASITRAVGGLAGSSALLTRVWFPRALIPVSGTLAALVDFLLAFAVLLGLMVSYGTPPAWTIVLCLPLLALVATMGTGIGMGLAALNVRWRDVGHAIPFFVQLWMFATPVVYSAELVPERWREVLRFNPMTGVLETWRAAALGRPLEPAALVPSLATGLLLAWAGVRFFRRTERRFADLV